MHPFHCKAQISTKVKNLWSFPRSLPNIGQSLLPNFQAIWLRDLCFFYFSAFKTTKLQMASNCRLFLIMYLVSLCLLPSLLANPMKAALASVHCERKGYTFPVKVVGCQERMVTVNTCIGTCLSFSTPTGSNYEQVESCTCCEPTKTTTIDVGLWCQDASNPGSFVKYFHKVKSATECSCASCWWSWA